MNYNECDNNIIYKTLLLGMEIEMSLQIRYERRWYFRMRGIRECYLICCLQIFLFLSKAEINSDVGYAHCPSPEIDKTVVHKNHCIMRR